MMPGQLIPCPRTGPYLLGQRIDAVIPGVPYRTAPDVLAIDRANQAPNGLGQPLPGLPEMPATMPFFGVALPLLLAGAAVGWALGRATAPGAAK